MNGMAGHGCCCVDQSCIPGFINAAVRPSLAFRVLGSKHCAVLGRAEADTDRSSSGVFISVSALHHIKHGWWSLHGQLHLKDLMLEVRAQQWPPFCSGPMNERARTST